MATTPPVGSIAPTDSAQAAASDKERAVAAEEQSAAAAETASGEFVEYTGPQVAVALFQENERRREKGQPTLPVETRPGVGTYAEITAKQWEQAGVKAERSHVWKLQNNYRLPASQFSAEQIDYLLTNSKRFQLVDAEGKPVKR
jgi:hypothetical protein